jgi:hypothetical protein
MCVCVGNRRRVVPNTSAGCTAPPERCCRARVQVSAATKQWDGTGSFVFTSSMSVCATDDGGEVNENCPLVPQGKSPSTDRCGSSAGS